MLEAAEFINYGMHITNLLKLIIYVYNLWPSVCHIYVVFNFVLSFVVYNPYLTYRIQSVADDASYDPRPSIWNLTVVFLSFWSVVAYDMWPMMTHTIRCQQCLRKSVANCLPSFYCFPFF